MLKNGRSEPRACGFVALDALDDESSICLQDTEALLASQLLACGDL